MRKFLIIAAVLALAATPALAEEYYWGQIGYSGVVNIDGYGAWGEVGFYQGDYYVHVYGLGDWMWIERDGDIWVDGVFWGWIDGYGDVYRESGEFLFHIEYDGWFDEFSYDGVTAWDEETVFLVLALEEKFFGWEVGLADVLDFNQAPSAWIVTSTVGSIYSYTFEAHATDLDGEVVRYRWDFGDGSESSARDPVHHYAFGGFFTVRLTVEDDGGATFTATKRVRVKSRPPKAFFKKKKSGTVLGGVRFKDRSRDRPGGTVVGWHWNFGDGTTSTDRNPVHIYAEPGRYVVTLTVTDDDGETGQKIKGVKVKFPKHLRN